MSKVTGIWRRLWPRWVVAVIILTIAAPSTVRALRVNYLSLAVGWAALGTARNPPVVEGWFGQIAQPQRGRLVGRLRMAQGRHEEAIDALSIGLSSAPEDEVMLAHIGEAYLETGQTVAALEAWARAGSLRRIESYAQDLSGQGRWSEAAQAYQAGLAAGDGSFVLHYGLGSALWRGGQDPLATYHLERAVALREGDVRPYLLLAEAAYETGGDLAALEQYERAIRACPTSPMPFVGQSRLHQAAGEWEKSAMALQQALALDPNCDDAYGQLGKLHLAQGRLEDAVDAFEHAIRLSPDTPLYWELLGSAWDAMGNALDASHAYCRSLCLGPQREAARARLVSVLVESGTACDCTNGGDNAVE